MAKKKKKKKNNNVSRSILKLYTLCVLENLEHHRVNCMGLVEWACSATEQLCCPGRISSPFWASSVSTSSSRGFMKVFPFGLQKPWQFVSSIVF